MNDWFLKQKKQNEHNTNAVTTRINVSMSERERKSARWTRERAFENERNLHLIAVYRYNSYT